MTCPQCGRETTAASAVCLSCGVALASAGEPMTIDAGPAMLSRGQSPAPSLSDAAVTAFAPVQVGADTEETGPLTPGTAFGRRYHIIRLIGLGGMGAVYQAWDSELGVVVALKVVRPEIVGDAESARDMERRFKRELLLGRKVTHKNVVRIHDLGEIDGIKYITMPFVEGSDLATVLRAKGKLSVAEVMRLARRTASGLAAAHHAGVVHRDLKPANIMVGADDEPLIMDFGIARIADQSADGADGRPAGSRVPLPSVLHTQARGIVGTVEYMAPEQARCEPVDQRADIYAFGLILYDLLLGRRRAEKTKTALEELEARLNAAPPPARTVDKGIPEALDDIISRCVQPDPKARFQTTDELIAALDRLDDEGRPRRVTRKVSARTFIATTVLLLAIAGGAWRWANGRTAPSAAAHEPVQVLMADFVNGTGDPDFSGSLERALGVGIEGASFITAYNRQDARRVATKLRAGATLDDSMARLVAVREGVKVVVTGSIAPSAGGYLMKISLVDPTSGRATWRGEARAARKADALHAVGALAADVRQALGDSGSATARRAAAETITTSSIEAMADYSTAQDLASAGQFESAIGSYRKAIEHDPKFGRAYSGWATAAFYLGRTEEAAANWQKALALMDRMSEREKYRTLGTYYLGVAHNYEKAIENYSTLVRLYPTDLTGYNNLAYAYFAVLNFPKAFEEGERARQLYPRNVTIGNNAALYAMYAGNFDAAARQARRLIDLDASFYKNYLPLAVAAVVGGDLAAARDAYSRMSATGTVGQSVASVGLADIAMYEGRIGDAEAMLTPAIAADRARKETAGAAAKLVTLAQVEVAQGNHEKALAAVKEALALSPGEATSVPAAEVLLACGRPAEARKLAAALGARLEPQSRAYAKIIEGNVLLREGRIAEAIDTLRESTRLADFWAARFAMGRAYVQAGHSAEGLAEFEACQRRRGEATAIFLDDVPTVRYLAELPYWMARAQEGVGQQAAARASYEGFLRIRAGAAADPLVTDAQRRLRSLVAPD